MRVVVDFRHRSECMEGIAVHDPDDFLVSLQTCVDHSWELGEYMFAIASKFSRSHGGCTDKEITLLKRVPLSMAEDHYENILIRL